MLSAAALLGDITVREDTSAMTEDEMVDSLVNYDVVLPTLGDIYSERIFKSCKKMLAWMAIPHLRLPQYSSPRHLDMDRLPKCFLG